MRQYIIRRLLMTIVVVFAAAILIFSIMYFVPGDPVKIMLGPDATQEQILAQRTKLGLEDPFIVQLGKFLYNVFLKFDLGSSWVRGTPVVDAMGERLPRTLLIGLLSVVFSSVAAIPLGISSAIHHDKWQDRAISVGSMACFSIPDFWLALMLVLLFSLKLNLLPSFGIGTPAHYVLPIVAASIHGIGTIVRQMRSSMLEVIRSDFVTTARAKGVKERSVIYRHMLPNALIPVVTTIGQSVARCVAGVIIIEQIFSIPGIGMYLTNAITARDYPIVRGCTIVFAIFTAILMLAVDLVYGVIDPRIKAQYIGMSKRRTKR